MTRDDDLIQEAHQLVAEVFGDTVAQACLADPTLTRLGRALDRCLDPQERLRGVYRGLDPSTVRWLSRRARNPASWLANRL